MQKIPRKDGIINVRAETLRERRTFAGDLAHHRCLVLADSFYEWRKDGEGKTPYRIMLETGEPFAFAGIWEENEDTDGHAIQTFAIITTDANELVAPIHNRMPVLLMPEEERLWIARDATPDRLLAQLRPYPPELMKMYPVSSAVNRATVDEPRLIQPEQ